MILKEKSNYKLVYQVYDITSFLTVKGQTQPIDIL